MRTSTRFRIAGYLSSALALVIIGLYFLGESGESAVGLWLVGLFGIVGTMIGAIVGESMLAEISKSNKK